MKAFVTMLVWLVANALQAELVEQPNWDAIDDAELKQVTIEQPLAVDTSTAKVEDWTSARNGVIGQFVQAPTPLAPINPLAKPEAGYGASNISRDTMTGRIMGLHLIKFEF